MKYLIIWGGATDSYSSSNSRAWYCYTSYINTVDYTGDDIGIFPVYYDGEGRKTWRNPTFRIIYDTSSAARRALGAYNGSVSRATHTTFYEGDTYEHYFTTGCGTGNTYLNVATAAAYIYGSDEGIDTLAASLDNPLNTIFVEMPSRTVKGTFKPKSKNWQSTFYDANQDYELQSLQGTTSAVASFAAMFLPIDFKYNGENYKAIAIAPRNIMEGTNQTAIDLFKEYPEAVIDSSFQDVAAIAIPSYDPDDMAYIPDMSDTHIEFIAGDEIEGEGLLEFEDDTEIPESLARFFDANFEEAGPTYKYSVILDYTMSWERNDPYEKMAVGAEGATLILTFTDSEGQDVSMPIQTGKDPAKYAVAGARLYDGDTGAELGYCEIGQSIELPLEVYNLQILIEFDEIHTYNYTVDGIQTRATWEQATPYEKMAVTAENANVILTFTDSDGQDVNMAFATGKDPAKYAVAGARLYDGDTGDEIGYCDVNESIELPADVYNVTITVEYKEVPEPEDITAYFYENAAEKNRVDKTDYLTEKFTQRGYLRTACDVTNPVMVFEYQGSSIPTFNYVYIPRFSRYYYLEKLVIIDTGLYEMYLKVDVLNSFKDTIKAQAGTVARNQYTYNEALTDGQRAVENTPHTSKHALTTAGTAIVQGLGDLDIDTPACYVISVLTSQT